MAEQYGALAVMSRTARRTALNTVSSASFSGHRFAFRIVWIDADQLERSRIDACPFERANR